MWGELHVWSYPTSPMTVLIMLHTSDNLGFGSVRSRNCLAGVFARSTLDHPHACIRLLHQWRRYLRVTSQPFSLEFSASDASTDGLLPAQKCLPESDSSSCYRARVQILSRVPSLHLRCVRRQCLYSFCFLVRVPSLSNTFRTAVLFRAQAA